MPDEQDDEDPNEGARRVSYVRISREGVEALLDDVHGRISTLRREGRTGRAKKKQLRKLQQFEGTLRNILRRVGADGWYEQQYELKRQRWVGVDGSLQVIPREWRPRVLPGLADIDVFACFQTLLVNLFPGQAPHVERYLREREVCIEEVRTEYGVPEHGIGEDGDASARAFIKTRVFLAAIFGRSPESIRREMAKFGKRKDLTPFLAGMIVELDLVRRHWVATTEGQQVLSYVKEEHGPQQTVGGTLHWNKHRGSNGGYDAKYSRERWIRDCESTAFSMFLSRHERFVVECAERHIVGLGGNVALLMHDGFMLDERFPLDLDQLATAVLSETEIAVRFVRKSG